jgi:hypothetical protein
MLRFVGGYQVDRNGNSVGVQLTDGEIALRLAQERRQIDAIAASGDTAARVQAAIDAGKPVSVGDLDVALAGKSVSERVLVKTDLRRRGLL